MIKKAIILAGGQGTRLRPVTLEIPKPLVPVQGVPILTWLVRLFTNYGVDDITVIYPTKWKQAFIDWKNLGVTLYEEKEPMGTMGAIVHDLDVGSDPIFVTNGDELKGLDLQKLAKFHLHQTNSNPDLGATIALVRVPNPSDYGVAEIEGNLISKFHEKPKNPPTDLISSGLYLINPSTFQIPPSVFSLLLFAEP